MSPARKVSKRRGAGRPPAGQAERLLGSMLAMRVDPGLERRLDAVAARFRAGFHKSQVARAALWLGLDHLETDPASILTASTAGVEVDEETERRGLDAVSMYANRSFVGLVCTRPTLPEQTGPVWIASGTLLRVGDRPVILTARHNVERADEVEALRLLSFEVRGVVPSVRDTGLVVPGLRGMPERRVRTISPPGNVRLDLPRGFTSMDRVHAHPQFDVALVEVKPEHEARLLELDPPQLEEVVAPADEPPPRESTTLFVVGLPAALVPKQLLAERNHLAVATLAYATGIRPGCGDDEAHPRRGLHLDWRHAADREGTLMSPVHPAGVSGGPVWRLRAVPGELVWTPSKTARIVGLASSLWPGGGDRAPECVRCESVSDFGGWLRATAAEIAGRK